MDPLTIAKIGMTVAPFAAKLFGKKPKIPSIGSINNRYMNMRPEGYVSPEDLKFGDLLFGKGAQMAGAQAGEETRGLERRAGALGYAPGARERAIGLINKRKIGALENADFARQSGLYGAYGQNKSFERQKMMTAWGAELAGSRDDRARRDLQNSTFWNSAMEFIPNAMNLFGGGGTGMGGSGGGGNTTGTFNPQNQTYPQEPNY